MDPELCGTGQALGGVLEDDAAGPEGLGLDAEVLVNLDGASPHHPQAETRVLGHGTRGEARCFCRLVAPTPHTRMLLPPTPGRTVVSLPGRNRQTVDGGLERTCVVRPTEKGRRSPMLDDALRVCAPPRPSGAMGVR